MHSRLTLRAAMLIGILIIFSSFANAQAPGEMYQVSTINALLQGVYDGEVTVKELKRHGDFGIGTFGALDGEMIALEGQVYQIKGNGQVLRVEDTAKTPFAAVTFFTPERMTEVFGIGDFDLLQKALNEIINDENYFYAIRIDGLFTYVKTRSVPAQSKPYRPLAEVTKTQPVFEFENIRGTLIGFWCPQYVSGINVPGYHLHFISADRQKGGHLLALNLQAGTVQLARITSFRMTLPGTDDFRRAALGRDYNEELKAVEK